MRKNIIGLLVTQMIILIGIMAYSGTEVRAAVKTMDDGEKFDATYYATSYPDVVAVLGKTEKALYSHYKLYGKSEGRLPYAGASAGTGAFDAAYYAARYPDVVAALGSDPAMLKLHYDLAGKSEGRFANALEENQKTTEAATTVTPAQAQTASSAPANGVTLASLPSNYMAITADVTLAGAGNGYMAKLVMKNPVSAISWSIAYDLYGNKPYNGKSFYIVENIGNNAAGGQVYTFHGLAPLGQTVNMMLAYDTATGMYYGYINGQLVAQGANTLLLGSNIYASVEAAGRDDGSSVIASFGNIRFKKVGTTGTNGDSTMFTRTVVMNPGLAIAAPDAHPYQYRNSYDVTAQGTIVGLNGYDWDSAFASCSVTAEFPMFN